MKVKHPSSDRCEKCITHEDEQYDAEIYFMYVARNVFPIVSHCRFKCRQHMYKWYPYRIYNAYTYKVRDNFIGLDGHKYQYGYLSCNRLH